MERLAFLQTKTFSRYYSLTTFAMLGLSIVFNFLGIMGDAVIQNIAGFLIVFGIVLLVGQILLVLNHADKTNKIGWYVLRLGYVTMFVLMLDMLLLISGQFIASFYLIGENSINANLLFSSIGMTSLSCFGIFLSWTCYHTYQIENVWRF